MNNKVVTLETDMPLYWMSEKSSNSSHDSRWKKKYLVSNRKGQNKSKSSLVQICDIKPEQFNVEAIWQIILVREYESLFRQKNIHDIFAV